MNKYKAKRILKRQQQKLYEEDINVVHHYVETAAYVKDIFGENSDEHKILKAAVFPVPGEDPIHFKNNFNKLLGTFIRIVHNIGIPGKQNFLYRWNDGWLSALFILIIGACYSLGYWVRSQEISSSINSNQISDNPTTPVKDKANNQIVNKHSDSLSK